MDLKTIIAPYVLSGLGLFFIGQSVREWIQGRHSRGWPAARGAITISRLEEGPRDRLWIRQYAAVLSYAFEVAGQTWTGNRITVDSSGYDLSYLGTAQAKVDQYPVGAPVEVYFDPADPSRSVLQRGVPRAVPIGLALGLCFLVAGVWLFTGH